MIIYSFVVVKEKFYSLILWCTKEGDEKKVQYKCSVDYTALLFDILVHELLVELIAEAVVDEGGVLVLRLRSAAILNRK